MFERITSEEFYVEKYEPTIWSKPPEGPWVVTLDNIATEGECEAMIEAGRKLGYERSKDVGDRKFDGTFSSKESLTRTSSNAWCVDECYENIDHQRVLTRVNNITDIPSHSGQE